MPLGARRVSKRIPKAVLYELVAEARRCGIGPRELGRAIRYSHEHLSRIGVHILGMGDMTRTSAGRWSDKLRDMVVDIAGDSKRVADEVLICHHCGGAVRPKEPEAA